MGWFSPWTVIVDGVNITSKLAPICTQISVVDKDGTASDTVSITMDDTNGRGILPRDQSNVVVLIFGSKVFEGRVDKVNSRGSRNGGRSISVTAKGFDVKGKVKDGQRWHMDDSTLEDVLTKSADKAGFAIKVDPELGKIERDYWSPDGASFLGYAQRLAKELNATFKIQGIQAIFTARGKELLPPVLGTTGRLGNIMEWDISPITARAKHMKATARYFDRAKAEWMTVEEEIGSERAEATNAIRSSIANESQAKENLQARKGEAERGGGDGSVTILLNPAAKAEAKFIAFGTRPGIDGVYTITGVTHKGNRSSGSDTKLQIKHPSEGAGNDSRRS